MNWVYSKSVGIVSGMLVASRGLYGVLRVACYVTDHALRTTSRCAQLIWSAPK